MNLLAQHGHQPSDKIIRGLQENVIDGVIFGPRYVKPEKMNEEITRLLSVKKSAALLIDPEYYATRYIGTPNNQLGYLEEWSYFVAHRRRDLVRTDIVDSILHTSQSTFRDFNVTGYIAPNIYISQSFDSVEAGIALNFIDRTKEIFEDGTKPVYATLAVDRRALLSPGDFRYFLNDISGLDNPPDGFYILIGGGLLDERSDITHTEIVDPTVIGGWMLINHILSLNGFRVINGYSDILTSFLGAAGGDSGATGWWSNLRVFTMGKYIKAEGGGRQPNTRYLSKRLLNRIKLDERIAYLRLLPEVNNGLSHDQEYDAGDPGRTIEAVQTWEAIKSLNDEILTSNLDTNMTHLHQKVNSAIEAYAGLSRYGVVEGIETINQYLEALRDGIEEFKRLAEL